MDRNGLYAEAQSGFRSGQGTADNTYILHALIEKYLGPGKRLYCAMIDKKKAFDCIVYDNLWHHMIEKGIIGQPLKINRSMYRQMIILYVSKTGIRLRVRPVTFNIN